MPDARFTINADASDQGFDANPLDVLTLRLKTLPVSGVSTVLFQVFDPDGFDPDIGIGGNPPRSSTGAPTLTLVGATSGTAVSPVAVDGTVEVTMPASAGHSWIVRSVVNGGMGTLPDGRTGPLPHLVHERMIAVHDANGCRAVVPTETTQYDDDGWAGALNAMRTLLGGTSIPNGEYAGQPAAWDGTAWAPSDALKLDSIASRVGSGAFDLGITSVDEDGLYRSGLALGFFAELSSLNTVRVYTVQGGVYHTLHRDNPYQHYFTSAVDPPLSEVSNLRMGALGDSATIGFLGAPPVGQQSIGPGTTQDQVDSIVAALVAFGLVTDDRVP